MQVILIIDDQPNIRTLLQYNMGSKYNVVAIENCLDALEWIDQNTIPDLIISDVMLPFMDGFQFIKTIRSRDKTRYIPVILLSARTRSEDRIKGLALGADDYVTKPFNPEELLLRTENILQRSTNGINGYKGA